ncbi:MAG: hypothetical protein MK081_12535 [Flavobacteriales bacterium]|nr:hypothetical protein [Flavobacteriales bacterium]
MRVLLLFLFIFVSATSYSQVRKDSLYRFRKAQEGVTIPRGSEWHNAKRAFSVFDIGERIIILHIWDPRSVDGKESIEAFNGWKREFSPFIPMTIIPDSTLHSLSDKEIDQLIERYEIEHPLLFNKNLSSLKLPEDFEAPGVLLIREDGRPAGVYYGEDYLDELELKLSAFDKETNTKIGLSNTRFIATQERMSLYTPMSFPTAVEASSREQRSYVADTENNRILLVDFDGQVNEVIGTGVRGLRDGRYGACQFNRPTGLALDEENRILYVADAGNHVIRQVDLKTRTVTNILGTGYRAAASISKVDSTNGPLNYPMALEFGAGKLTIAMAGSNQVWQYDVKKKQAIAMAGNGAARSIDGTGIASAINEPIAITTDKKGTYYVLEQGAKNVRVIDPQWNVSTLEVMGKNDSLNYPQSIAFKEDELYIADTYNNRIVKYNKKKTEVVAGTGMPGFQDSRKDGELFNKPMGLSVKGDEIWVADCFNHSLRIVDSKKGKTKTQPLTRIDKLFRNIEAYNEGDRIYLEELIIGPGENSLYIELETPEGYELVPDGRNEVFMERPGMNQLLNSNPSRGYIEVEVAGKEMNPYAGMQIYVTMRHKETEQVIFRPVLLVVPFLHDTSGPTSHDLKFNLLQKQEE